MHGMINPADFILTAETAGDIVIIGDRVFREAVKQCADWRSCFDEQFQISVITSPIQYRNPSIGISTWKRA